MKFFGGSPLTKLRTDGLGTSERARLYLARANGNASKNTYLHLDAQDLLRQASRLESQFPLPLERPPLFGVPVSVKDCFDVAGTVTTCGSRFYECLHEVAEQDSAVVARVRAAGCVLMGKTHLHPLAYGITGQNAEYGDCLQPRDAGALTGGSSSGAAASVQEGSAVAAIGTDTGGSIRVPAALCGLVGFRGSQARGTDRGAWPEMWHGAAHLAPSFDTLGVMFSDPRDAGELVGVLLGVERVSMPGPCRIGWVPEAFLHDADADVLEAYRAWRRHLQRAGANLVEVEVPWWEPSTEIFAGIQACEAAELHPNGLDRFEAGIAQRIRWGASLTPGEVAHLRALRASFCERMAGSMEKLDLIMLPCAPVSRLTADVDAGAVRQKILRYTTPISLVGMAAMALPGELLGAGAGTGVQMAGRNDAEVLSWLEWIGNTMQD